MKQLDYTAIRLALATVFVLKLLTNDAMFGKIKFLFYKFSTLFRADTATISKPSDIYNQKL